MSTILIGEKKNKSARFSKTRTAAAFTAFVCSAQGPVASLILCKLSIVASLQVSCKARNVALSSVSSGWHGLARTGMVPSGT